MRSAQTAAADKGQSVELSRYPLQRVLVKVASVGAYYCTNAEVVIVYRILLTALV